MSLIEISLVVLVPLVLIGGMAAALFGFIYGIVKKQPGVIAASVAAPFILLVGGFLFVGLARFTSEQAKQTPTVWTPTVQMPSMQVHGAVRAPGLMDSLSMEAPSPAWTKIAILVLILAAIVYCIRKAAGHAGERSGGWLKTLCVAAIVVVVLNLFFVRVSYQRNQEAVSQAMAESMKQRDEAVARQNDAVAQHEQSMNRQLEIQARQYAEAAEKMTKELEGTQTMQQMWDKVTRPRIEMDAVGQTAIMKSTGNKAIQAVVLDAVKTPESIENSLARLERMVAQVSAVADQVSDTGTLIGKAMIALNETMDSRSRTKYRATEMTAEKTDETVAGVDQVSVAMAPVLTEPNIPVRRTLEIVLDQGKLNQFETSFEKIKTILGRDGRWHGTTVRFVPQERRIFVSGDFEDDYAARLRGTLVNTVGKHRTPIHLSDLATITTSPEPVVLNDGSGEASAERPAWVDEAPKNVGNVRRQVIVAGDFATQEECNREMDLQLYLATYNRIREISNSGLEPLLDTGPQTVDAMRGEVGVIRGSEIAAAELGRMGVVGIDFIRREIAKQEFTETVERSFGPMKKHYTQIEFSPSIDHELLRRWDEFRRSERFVDVGVGAGSVLGLIGLAFGLLRVDTWTKGYYSKRLFLGVPAAIIGAITLLVLAAG